MTFAGRLFCIFCALIGIPLNLGVLKTVGERITKYIRSTVKHIEKKHLKRRSPNRVGVKVAGVAFIMMVIVLLVGGASDMVFDGWTFFDGVYFNFITFSTIGFGDLFPRVEKASKLDELGFGENGKRLFVSCIMLIFMIIGLSVTSTVLCSILQAVEEMSHVPATWTSVKSSAIFSRDDSVKLESIKEETDGGTMQSWTEEIKCNDTS